MGIGRTEYTNDGRMVTYPNNPLTRLMDRASSMGHAGDDDDEYGGPPPNMAHLASGGPTVRSADLGQEVPMDPDEKLRLNLAAVQSGVRPQDVGMTEEEVLLHLGPGGSDVEIPTDDDMLAGIRAAKAARRGVSAPSRAPSAGAFTAPLAVTPTTLPDFRELRAVDFVLKSAVIGSVSVPLADGEIKALRKATLNYVLATVQRALIAAIEDEQERPDAAEGESKE